MGNPSDPYLRPRSRRCRKDLNVCQDCKVVLGADNWSPSMRGETGHRPRYICRPCWSARQRRYASNKSPEDLRAMKKASRAKRQAEWSDDRKARERRRRYGNWLKRNYDITIDEYEYMFKSQDGRCAICRADKPEGRGGFHVDHCHLTGTVRGLLCATCNLLLGHADDSISRLAAAIEYLKRNR